MEKPFFITKYRNLKKLKKTLFLNTFNTAFYFIPNFRLNLFVLHVMSLDFFPIKKYLEAQERKKIHNPKINLNENSLKNFHINADSVKRSHNIRKKPFILLSLRSFLLSNEYWSLQKKNSRVAKNYNEQFNLLNKKKINIRAKFRVVSSCPDGYFIDSYFSISKYFCWENPVHNAHFIYYMTSFPNKKDFLIFQYYFSIHNKLHKRNSFPQAGAQIFNLLLKELSQTDKLKNLSALERQIRINLFEMSELSSLGELFQRVKLLRRLKLVWYFRLTLNKPSWMILSNLPVLPPDLRPIIQLEDNQIAISDLNKLYQKVLFRNNRIQKLKIGHYSNTSEEIQYAQRLLQESVDSLIENGKGGVLPSSALNGRPLKSLSDILKGKKGRFRQNLLGKRVDYSGRSVIVVGPHLQLYECGIPKEMALELFQPFLIRRLIFQKKARTILGAKKLIQKGGPIIQEILYEIIQNHPILLNRAPTLHRLSIQSFQPKLVEGRAIILHPLVCAAFNADFDGDQMAVHVPLSYEARSEAWKLLWAQNNLLSPATGQPVLMPTQDMVLGWYYLTAIDPKNFYINLLKKIKHKIDVNQIKQIFQIQKINSFYQFRAFKKSIHIFSAHHQNKINIHTPIWFYWKGFFETDKKYHPILEIRLNGMGNVLLFSYQFQFRYNWCGLKISQVICTTPGRVLVNLLTQ